MHSRRSPHTGPRSPASPGAGLPAGIRSAAWLAALGAALWLDCRALLAAGGPPARGSAPLWFTSWSSFWPSFRPSFVPDFWASSWSSSGPHAWLTSVLGSWGDAWPQLLQDTLLPLLLLLAKSLALIIALLIVIAFLLLFDRKVWAAVQLRRGPNVVGPFGLLQSFADLLKFVLKEPLIPAGADKGVFLLAPLVASVLALAAWAVIPLNANASGRWVISDLNVGVLYLFAISSLGVYGVIMGGWASNSKYPFLGALRSAAQMVSYEVSIGFVIITVLLTVGSLNMTDIVEAQRSGIGTRLGFVNSALDWNWLALLPMFIVFFVSALAETNRPPFDLPEAESELVAGFAVEYSSTPYLLFMLGEYVAITTMCALTTIMFLGGWLPPVDLWPLNQVPGLLWFVAKLVAVFFMFAMVKAFVPRYRYDQLMRLGWKVFLPLSLLMVVLVAAAQYLLELAP